MAKAGRPSRYDPDEHPKLMRQLIGEGKTLWDISQVFGVAWSTLTAWRELHPEITVAIKLGKEDAIDRVERSLFERATGYNFPSEKIMVVSDGAAVGSHVERVPITEHCPPDVAAIKYLLNNRRSKEWVEKQQLEHSGKITLEDLVSGAEKETDRS